MTRRLLLPIWISVYRSLFWLGMWLFRYSQERMAHVKMWPAIWGSGGSSMRKLLLAGTAIAVVMAAGSAGAADLSRPVYKAPPPIPVFSWTGWYVGVHVGGAWGTKEWSDPITFDGFATTTSPDATLNNYGVNGFLGGLQIGYNYQSGPWVWGVEARPAGPAFAAGTLASSSGKAPARPMSTRWEASRCGSAAPSAAPCCT